MEFAVIPPNCDMAPADEIEKDRIYDKILPINAGMTVVDVGASIGFFSMYASQKVGASGKIIAFEPEPTSYNALVLNTNKLGNVVPLQKAVWNQKGNLTLYPTSVYTGSSLFKAESIFSQSLWFPTDKSVSVETVRLDTILPEMGITHVDFVKIDAEGAGNKILEGTEGIIGSIENFAIAAYHTQENPQEMIKFLKSHGFRTKMLLRYGITPYIYATRNPNINLAYVELWQVLAVMGFGGLLFYSWDKK